ncbi:MAG: PilT/PilU family type 4a pilus ATPase [Planctomycetes bacterium]|nr:PilT/PilU family type 4a pilus ATPase [Planctomycetota bacterium]
MSLPQSSSSVASSPSPNGVDSGEASAGLKDMEKLLVAMVKNKASDLHLKSGLRPILRIGTILHEVGQRPMSREDVKRLCYEIMDDRNRKHLDEIGGADFAYSIDGVGRYRVNIFMERGQVAAAIRRVSTDIPSFEQLNLPPAIAKMCSFNQGLVVFVGPTGQGKSTSLASILQWINENRKVHIITIEDPIEYLFKDAKSFVNQREIGIDTPDFNTALKHIVRQNPDVILLGEMRDSHSVDAALLAAETGHLCFGTIHASSAGQTIGRMLDLFPPERQDQIRQLLVFNLKAIAVQKLMPSCKEGVRMVPAVELMIVNPSIQKLLNEKEDKKIQDVVRGGSEEGMQDFNQSLVKLVNAGLVSKKIAMQYSPNPDQLKMNLQGIYLGEDHKILG